MKSVDIDGLFPKGYPEILTQIGAAIVPVFEKYGLNDDQIKSAVMDATEEIREAVSGAPIYIPRLQSSRRNIEIYNKFTGDPKDYITLGHAYGLTEVSVRNIVKVQHQLAIERRQPKLAFD